jgi:poly-gamma-glutamate capsule biosynthesis protein CapA/YwtB (metallophosphatase superfamily)
VLLAAVAWCHLLLSSPPPRPQGSGPRDTLRIYAVGDINLGRTLARDSLTRGDTLYPFRALVDTLRAADVLFGNLESPIAADAHRLEKAGLVFTAPRHAAASLARAGFTIVSTANNHAWDGGRASVEETMRRLTAAGVLFVGSGYGRPMAEQPVIVRKKGWRVAFFAVTRAWNPAPMGFYAHAGAGYIAWGDPAWIYPAIRAIKASHRVDLVVVSVHGGMEYAETPQPSYQSFLRGLVDAGADLVLGHHPHVLQPVVRYKGKPIAQSLGNFIFHQEQPWTQLSAVLRIEVAPDLSMRLSALPVRADYQATLATGAAADSVARRLGVPITH